MRCEIHTTGLEPAGDGVELLGLAGRQRAGWLVKDQDLETRVNGPRDLDELGLRDGQSCYQLVHVEIETKVRQLCLSIARHGLAVDEGTRTRIVPGEDVLRHRQVREEVGVLEHGSHT
jgi:hypothetical protein